MQHDHVFTFKQRPTEAACAHGHPAGALSCSAEGGCIPLLDNDQRLTWPWLQFPMAVFVGLVIKTEDRWAAQGDEAGWMILRGHWLKACVVGMGVVQVCQCPRESVGLKRGEGGGHTAECSYNTFRADTIEKITWTLWLCKNVCKNVLSFMRCSLYRQCTVQVQR